MYVARRINYTGVQEHVGRRQPAGRSQSRHSARLSKVVVQVPSARLELYPEHPNPLAPLPLPTLVCRHLPGQHVRASEGTTNYCIR